MKIVYFDGSLIQDPELTYKIQDTLLGKMIENVVQAAQLIHDADIEVVLIDNRELLGYWDIPDTSPGFHAITAGPYENHDQDSLSAAHRVVIMVDEIDLRSFIEEESAMDITDHRGDYLADYLVIVTHELMHCIEFISSRVKPRPLGRGCKRRQRQLAFN